MSASISSTAPVSGPGSAPSRSPISAKVDTERLRRTGAAPGDRCPDGCPGRATSDRRLSCRAAWATRAPAPSRRAGVRALAARPAGALRRPPPLSGGRRTRRCDRLPPRRRHASRRLRDLARDFRRLPPATRRTTASAWPAPRRCPLRDLPRPIVSTRKARPHCRAAARATPRCWELHLVAGAKLSPRPAPRRRCPGDRAERGPDPDARWSKKKGLGSRLGLLPKQMGGGPRPNHKGVVRMTREPMGVNVDLRPPF